MIMEKIVFLDFLNLIEETFGKLPEVNKAGAKNFAVPTHGTYYCETEKQYLVKVLLPGVVKSTLETEIKESGITIKGEFDLKVPADAKAYSLSTSNLYSFNTSTSKSFVKVIDLPAQYSKLNLDSVKASYVDGILTITVDKKTPVSTGYKIKIE